MRTASALRAAGISGHKINRALYALRREFPVEIPLSGLAIQAAGNRVAVRAGSQSWEADTGQYLLRFDTEAATSVESIGSRGAAVPADAALQDDTAQRHFMRGYVAEADDVIAAMAAYRECLHAMPHHREARINLGRLLHLTGMLEEAEHVYAAAASEKDCDLSFNLGVVLEDLGRDEDAVTAYREALSLDPSYADAHYNLARLHDAAGRPSDSLRHLLAYRRLSVLPP